MQGQRTWYWGSLQFDTNSFTYKHMLLNETYILPLPKFLHL